MTSYAAGDTGIPLIEETIGANFARIAATYGDREALVEVATGRRWTYAELDADVDALARGLIAAGIAKGDRVGIWAPNCAEWTMVQYATAKVGAILVNVNPAYRTHELAYALNQSGLELLIAAESFKSSDYRAMVEEVRGDAHALERVVYLGTDDWSELVGAGEDLPASAVPDRMGTLEPGDADQHPVHLRDHRLPQGRDPLAPQHPQQRLLHDRDDQLHRAGPAARSRCPSTTASGW